MENFKTPKRIKDKSDRATFDAVLDKKTLNILSKLTKRDMLSDLSGCLSTGKEANVYFANASTKLESKLIKSTTGQESTDFAFLPCAIKIYQTSIMQFKDRLKYIQSEKRFVTFCSTNPRKLVKLWAEKEVRNLKRLQKANIPSPKPIYLKNNVLIMTLIYVNGNSNDLIVAAPRLKDYKADDYEHLYLQAIVLLDDMYNKCNLVHSDFSEYNLLVADDTLYVIDMGQAVEKCHDNADEFLIKDIGNTNAFFQKKDCHIENINIIFERITKKKIPVVLRQFDLLPGSTIPNSINDVTDDADYIDYLKESESENDENENSYGLANEICSAETCDEENVLTKDERNFLKKEERKAVKEKQREKRRTKIPKKEKRKRERSNKKRK